MARRQAIAGRGTKAERGGLAFVFLISTVSAMGGFLFGYETVVIAATISLVKSQFGLTEILEGWYVSSGLVGCVAGVLVASWLSDRVGRKGVSVLSGVLLTAAALGCAAAPAAAWLIAARVVGGIGVGMASIVSPLYISEVAPPAFRGRLVSLFQVTITVGIVAAMAFNAGLQGYATAMAHDVATGLESLLFVHQVWRGMFLLQAIPAAIFFAAALLVPESPRWLVARTELVKARRVLLRLRGNPEKVERELEQIQASVESEANPTDEWSDRGIRRAVRLGILLAVFSELSGITIVMYYGPTILEHTGASLSASLDGHMFIGVVLAVFTLLAIPLIDRIGRKKLLLTGVAGACVALAFTGAMFLMGRTDGVVIVGLLCAFVAFFAFSIGPIKWVVISEIFPTKLRARAMGVATVALWLTDIAINQLFPIVRQEFGVQTMFFAFAAFLALQFVVMSVVLPETKGITLEQAASLWGGAPAVGGLSNEW